MQILIKTPFHNNNKYLPHLLEHCILHNQNIEIQLHFSDIYAYTSTGYTWFEREHIPIKKIVDFLKTPITYESFVLHQKIIKNELRAPSFWQKVYEKTLQKIFNKNIFTNTVDDITFDEVLAYQKTRYQESNMIFIKENWMIDTTRWKWKNLQTNVDMSSFYYPEYCSFSYQKEKQHVLVLKNQCPSSILILDFFWAFCEELCYIEEIKKWKYFSEWFQYSFTDQWFLISREDNFPQFTKIKLKIFFDVFKNYYCEKIVVWAKRAFIPHIALFFNLYISEKEHQNLIQSLDFSKILELAKIFKLLK